MAIEITPSFDAPEPVARNSAPGGKPEFFGKDGFGFFDFLDIINPLQHIPILSGLYRKLTGDEISPGARLVGGTLFGGPIGFAAALANVVVEETSGEDIGGHLFAAVGGGDGDLKSVPVNVASAAPGGGDGGGPKFALADIAGVAPFGGGLASGADPGPVVDHPAFSFAGTPIGNEIAARNGLFALSLAAPARADGGNPPRKPAAGRTEDRFDRNSAGRVQDLSTEQLVQILTQFQSGTGAAPGGTGLKPQPGPPSWPGILPLDQTL